MNQLTTQKKIFSIPQIEFIAFTSEDILTSSGIPDENDEDEKSENMDSNGWT